MRHSAITQAHAKARHALHGEDWQWQHYIDHTAEGRGGWAHTHDDTELSESVAGFKPTETEGQRFFDDHFKVIVVDVPPPKS